MPHPRKKTPISILILSLLLSTPTQAALIITTDTTINSTINDDIEIRNNATVTITEGANITGKLTAHDASTLNINGGNIETLSLRQNSSLTATGGQIIRFFSSDNAQSQFSDNITVHGISTNDSSRAKILGGALTRWGVTTSGNSLVDVFGGEFTRDHNLLVYFYSRDHSTLRFHMINSDLPFGPFQGAGEALSGTLADGTYISPNQYLWLETQYEDAQILILPIPEPTTAILLTSLTLFISHRPQFH